MKLILAQYRPAIRLYKWAVALEQAGHEVAIAHTHDPVGNLNWSRFNIGELKSYRIPSFDRYISFNPGVKGISMPLANIPVIQAVGDLKSMTAFCAYERTCLFHSERSVYVSGSQRDWACKNLQLKFNSTEVFYNGVIREMVGEPKPKINNGKINIVYSGTTYNQEGHHRNILSQLKALARLKNVQVHLYPSALGVDDSYLNNKVVVHDTVDPYDLIGELSQYDAGLMIVNSQDVGDVMMPNKLFEYLAAGLPVIAGGYKAVRYFAYGKDGFWISDDLKSIDFQNWLLSIKAEPPDMRRYGVYYDDRIKELDSIILLK